MAFFKHDGATTFLERFFDSDKRLIQNLLFWGEESVGKMTTAEVFSEALFCNNRKGWERCGECSSCKMLEKGYHPDRANSRWSKIFILPSTNFFFKNPDY